VLDWGGWSTPWPSYLNLGKDQIPILQEVSYN